MIQATRQFTPILNKFSGLEKEQKGISGFGALFAGILAGNNIAGGHDIKSSDHPALFSDLPSRGNELVNWLKKYIQSHAGGLDAVTADADALSWFRNFLIHAGFDKNKVDGIINQLKENSNGGNISLKDLFAGVSTLEEEETNADDCVPISMLPFLQSILSSVGLNDAEIESVLEDAKAEGNGIFLSRLIVGLKGLDTASYNENSVFALEMTERIKTAVQDVVQENGAHQTAMHYKRVGMMTLDDVIAELESMQADRSNANFRGYLVSEDIKGFLAQLHINKENIPDTNLAKNVAILSAMGRLKSGNDRLGMNTSDTSSKSPFNSHENTLSGKDFLFKQYVGNPENPASLSARGSDSNSNPKALSADMTASFSREFISSTTRASGSKSESTPEFGYQTIKYAGYSDTNSLSSASSGSAKNLPFYMLNQVGKQIFRSIQNGEKEMLLQLKPPHLGRLKMSLETVKDVIRVSIVTENQTTQELLKNHVHELKAALQEQGIRLEKLDVRLDFNFEQSTAQTRQENKESKERNQPVFRVAEKPADDWLHIEDRPSMGVLDRDGMLDLVI